MTPALETVGLRKSFGGLAATNDVSIRLAPGARHALIGPNGAGKTTLVNLLAGALAPSAGRVLLDGHDVTRLAMDRRVRLGLGRTFQIHQLFGAMTPAETLGLAISERRARGGDAWHAAGADATVVEDVVDIAGRFGLADVLEMKTSALAYGKQRLLEIAVAFAGRPRVLLLDEPAAGVPENERHELLGAVASLPRDVAVLLIEHDMDVVFSFAERISVLVDGAIFAEGPPEEIAQDPRVRAVYLGEGERG
jgi:branched-chain amino acid transport system ATP-binding protein